MTELTDDAVKALLNGAATAYDLEIVKWKSDIRCVYLNDYRVAGEKPWGGGDTIRRFKVSMADIMGAFRGTVQAAAPAIARALLATRAELAQARADAQAAVALVVERAATQADPWDGPVTKNKIVDAQAIAAQQIKARIRALAPADGLAAVEALRARERESAMQALASMGQAQEAYEAQLKAEADRDRLAAALAAAKQREAGLVERAEKAEAERDKWFEGAGAHHVASMQQAQRADIAEAELAAIRNGETS